MAGGGFLLKRLWPGAANLSPERVSHILTVADVDEAHLRGLLVEGRALPVGLRDTLERFAADARIEAFFVSLEVGEHDTNAWQWCINKLGLQGQSLSAQTYAIKVAAESLRGLCWITLRRIICKMSHC